MMADGGDIVNINERRKQLNLTLKEIADYVGVSEATVSRWESGNIANMRRDRIAALAQILKVSPIDIMGVTDDDNYDDSIKSVQIPVLGRVKAGIPMTAIESIIDYEEISQEQARTGEFFGLQIKGDSMEPKISEGDVVIVRKQETVENGEIAVVLINGDDATVKKFYKTDAGIKLVSTNPTYDPFFYTPDEVNALPVSVIGKVVELRAKF
nr:MAG TPA: Repressor protein CI [Caudoviricetes sp.]